MLVSFALQYLTQTSQITIEQQMLWSNVLQTVVSLIFSLLYLPLQLTAMTIVYFDLRVRSEGLDLALQASDSPGTELEKAAALPEIASDSKTALLTGTEVGYFVLLTLAGGALYALIFGVLFGLLLAVMPASGF
jgi:hypothetical protein